MIALFATSLLASVAGSLHCAGMCGPLLALVQGGRSSRSIHAAYQAGRLAAYTVLGLAAGALGHGIETLATSRGLTHAGIVVAGVALVLVLATPLLRPRHDGGRTGLRVMRAALRTATPLARASLFGAATGLMPCGWLYAWIAIAAASGSALGGAVIMLGFGLGSVPALVATNALFAGISKSLRGRSRWLAPMLLAVSAIAIVAIRGTVIERLQHALDSRGAQEAPLVCHGG